MRHFSELPTGLTLLTEKDMNAVAGGNGEDYDEMPEVPIKEFEPIEVIARVDPKKIAEGIRDVVVGVVSGVIGGVITEGGDDDAREKGVAHEFMKRSVDEVISVDEYGAPTGWRMSDGTEFYDHNRNGTPDQQVWWSGDYRYIYDGEKVIVQPGRSGTIGG